MKNFQVYKSSAGSGKTYTLVKEYLRIVLSEENPTRYRNILAITFTNKAANELKERILENLKKLSSNKNSTEFDEGLLNDYAHEFGLDETILKQRSKAVFETILHNYSDLKVSTIDKFTHKIIRAFSRDLGLTNDFEIEMDTDLLLKSTINNIIAEVGINKELSKILIKSINKQIDGDKSWDVEDKIFKFSKELIKEENIPYLEEIQKYSIEDFSKASEELKNSAKALENEIKLKAREVLDIISKTGVEYKAFPRSTFPNYYKNIEKGEFGVFLNQSKTVLNIISGEAENWLTKANKNMEASLLDPSKPIILELNKELENILSQYFLINLLFENIYSVSLINFIYQNLEQQKNEQGILLISDFNKIISSEIKDQPAPFIYEKIGERYKNIMVDEFQDTSVLQWQNLLPLIDNSLSTGNENLLVGDAKQAIYRFRGGKVEQFIQLPNIFDHQNDAILLERENALRNNFEEKVLDTNWRSHAQVIDFNNWFFEKASHYLNESFTPIYEQAYQKSIAAKNEGFVKIDFIAAKESEDIEEDYLKKTLFYINENLTDNFNYKDIAILVRGKKESIMVSDYLLENDIPVITSESLVIHKNPEVNFLVHFFKFINNNYDNKAKVEILKFLYSPLELTKLLTHYQTINLGEILSKKGYQLQDIITLDVSIYDLAEHIIRTFKLKKEETNPYLVAFLDKIKDFSRYQNDLSYFLDWWDEKGEKISISTPEDTNAISIMTIHKSKGLQFPVVICPFANWNFTVNSNTPQKWVHIPGILNHMDLFLLPLKKELTKTKLHHLLDQEQKVNTLDNFNLLYVALTRPEKRLYVISDNDTYTSKNEFKDNQISSYIWLIANKHPDFNIESVSLTIGNRTLNKNQAKNKSFQGTLLKNIHTVNWRSKVSLSETYKKDWDTKEYQKTIAFGNKIHLALSYIDKPQDIENVLHKMVEDGNILENEKTLFLRELNDIMNIPQVMEWFSSSGVIKNEQELITKHGDILRPDKVIIENNKVILIDYKTGEENKKHEKQVLDYSKHLIEMGYKNIECYIFYTTLRKIIKVD